MQSLPDYGIDAPGVVRAFGIGGAVLLFGGTITAFILQNSQPMASGAFLRADLWWGSCRLLTATILFGSSRVGKLRVRDRLMGSLHWTGEEQVLDVGCGSGLALIGAAKRLTTGRATGVDIWSAEGVLDRVQLRTGDARDLPFPSASFDTVVSMTAIHNIKDPAERQTALREMLRVLKPGGQLAIFDIFHAGKYADVLRQLGAEQVRISGLILLWCLLGRRITARKPSV